MAKRAKRKTLAQKKAENSAVVRCEPGACEDDGKRHFDGESHVPHCKYCGRVMDND